MLASTFFDSSNAWFGYVANFFFAATAFGAIGRMLYKIITKHYDNRVNEVRDEMNVHFKEILGQYKPNGGSSGKDQWNRMESKVDHLMGIEHQVDKLSKSIDRHLGYHEGLRAAHDEEE